MAHISGIEDLLKAPITEEPNFPTEECVFCHGEIEFPTYDKILTISLEKTYDGAASWKKCWAHEDCLPDSLERVLNGAN